MSIYMSKKSGQKSQEGKKYSELCDGDKGLVLKELLKGDLSHQYFFFKYGECMNIFLR